MKAFKNLFFSTINKKLISLQILVSVSFLTMGYFAITSINSLDELISHGSISKASTALRNAMQADMMHDALRGDVINSLLVSGESNSDLGTKEAVEKDLEEHISTFNESIETAKNSSPNTDVTKAIEEVLPALNAYGEAAKVIVKKTFENREEALKDFPKFMEAFSELEERMENLSGKIDDSVKLANQELNTLSEKYKHICQITLAIGFVSTLLLGWIIANSIQSPLKKVVTDLEKSSSSTQLISRKLSDASETVASATKQQSAAVQESVAALAEMKSMITQTTENAKDSLKVAQRVTENSEEGKVVMQKMVNSIDSIQQANSQLQNIVTIIKEISAKTLVINDIVFKTQLLSFNASIEAARAGQHGRGFSVVAEEVGNLAQMSGNAAKEIQTLLTDSQQQVAQILEITGQRVNEGQKVSTEALASFDVITKDIQAIAERIQGIAEATNEQLEGINQSYIAMDNMDKSTISNSKVAEQAAQSASELKKQSHRLFEIMKSTKNMVFGSEIVNSESSKEVKTKSAPKPETEIISMDSLDSTLEMFDEKDFTTSISAD
ncbi:MAG: hypothetical protein KBC84_00960 [Proteobacteria bacterium]|nr:hypothetical protein [Pseudomonadota bacterium]